MGPATPNKSELARNPLFGKDKTLLTHIKTATNLNSVIGCKPTHCH